MLFVFVSFMQGLIIEDKLKRVGIILNCPLHCMFWPLLHTFTDLAYDIICSKLASINETQHFKMCIFCAHWWIFINKNTLFIALSMQSFQNLCVHRTGEKSEGHIHWETRIFLQNVIYFTYFSLDQSGCSLLVCLAGLTNHKMLQSL